MAGQCWTPTWAAVRGVVIFSFPASTVLFVRAFCSKWAPHCNISHVQSKSNHNGNIQKLKNRRTKPKHDCCTFAIFFQLRAGTAYRSFRNKSSQSSYSFAELTYGSTVIEQSLFSSDFVRKMHARASIERQIRATRETRLSLRAWSFLCLACIAWRTEKKERLLVVYRLWNEKCKYPYIYILIHAPAILLKL